MAEAAEMAEWNRAALVCSLLAEPYRDPKTRGRPFTAATFHPYTDEAEDGGGDADCIPYNPKVLEAIQASGKF